MDMPAIADWCTISFFLSFGLKTFIPALDEVFFSTLAGIIALPATVTTFIDRNP